MNKMKVFALVAALAALLVVGGASAANPVLFELTREVPSALTEEALTIKVAAPLTKTPTRLTSTTISAAAWAEFPAADIAEGLRSHDVVQSLVVTNFDAAARICVDYADRNTDSDPELETTDCSTACSALTSTCSGASADADMVLPNQQREFRPSGRMCICYLSSAANGDAQFSLTVR